MTHLAIDRRRPAWPNRYAVVTAMIIVAGTFLAAIVVGTPGCSFSYDYEINGVVRDAADGAPLSGVTVTLKLQPLTPPTKWVGAREKTAAQGSAINGSFSLRSQIYAIEFTSTYRWVLSLTKSGYDEAIVDISQHREPQSGSQPDLIAIANYMHKNAPDAPARPAIAAPR